MMYVVNIAVKKDNKVECDTMYAPADALPTQAMCEDICKTLGADGVIMSVVGRFIPYKEAKQMALSFIFERIKEIEKDDNA